jgi:hypothetical protein
LAAVSGCLLGKADGGDWTATATLTSDLIGLPRTLLSEISIGSSNPINLSTFCPSYSSGPQDSRLTDIFPYFNLQPQSQPSLFSIFILVFVQTLPT